MRKRLANLSKRCMVAIMSATMLMSSVTVSMAFPVGVYADGAIIDTDIDENNESNVTISQGVTVDVNKAQVDYNYGTINTNNSYVYVNFSDVQSNNSTVERNLGTVNNSNNGYVHSNLEEGTVTGSGTVHYNCGGIVDAGVNVENQFYYVKAEGFDNATVDIESDASGLGIGYYVNDVQYNREYVREHCGGTVTLTPDADYEIIGDEVTEPIVEATFRYTISRDDEGVVTVTISDVTGNISLNPGILGLAVQKIMKQENIDSANVVLEDDKDDDDEGAGSGPIYFDPNAIGSFYYTPEIRKTLATDRVNRMLADNTKNIFDLEYKNQSNLTWEEFELLCSTRSDAPKNCYFTIDGKLYILHIPAMNPYTDAFKACLAKLKSEGHSLAGPVRIAEICKDLGVTCTDQLTWQDFNRLQQASQNAGQSVAVNNPVNASFDQISIVPSFDPTVTSVEGRHFGGGLDGEAYNMKVLLGDVLALDSSDMDGLLETADVLMLRTTFGYCSFSLREISDSYPDLQSIKCNLTKDGVEIYVDGKLYKSLGSADFSSVKPY